MLASIPRKSRVEVSFGYPFYRIADTRRVVRSRSRQSIKALRIYQENLKPALSCVGNCIINMYVAEPVTDDHKSGAGAGNEFPRNS